MGNGKWEMTRHSVPYAPMRGIRIAAFFLALPLAAADRPPSSPDTADQTSPPRIGEYSLFSGDYWKGYASDAGHVLTAPSRWKKRDYGTFAMIAGTTAGLYFADREVRDRAQKNRNETTDDLADVGEHFGNGAVLAGFTLAHYGIGWAFGDERSKRTALLSLESLALSGLFTAGLKGVFHRHRPDTGKDHDTFDGPGFSTDSDELSFPSGHTTSAFSVATVLATEYREVPLVVVAAYGAAALAGLSRVNDDEHWASDVFAGAAIGYFTAKAIMSRHAPEAETRRVALLPLIDEERAGLALTCRF